MGQQLSCTLLTAACCSCTVWIHGVSGETRGSKVRLDSMQLRGWTISLLQWCVFISPIKALLSSFWAATEKLRRNNFLQAMGSRQEFWELSFLAARSQLSFAKSTEMSSRAWISCVSLPLGISQSCCGDWRWQDTALGGGRTQPWAGAALSPVFQLSQPGTSCEQGWQAGQKHSKL